MSFLPSPPNDIEKYSYILKYPIFLKILYSIGMISWLGVVLGYIQFFNHNLIYWAFIAPVIVYITVFQVSSTYINFFYERFKINKHNRFKDQFWQNLGIKPKVDVFLPVCGEDIEVIKNTWKGVKSMSNDRYILNPIALDDVGNIYVENLAKEFCFEYLSRPNKGEVKKAGNLKYGFDRSDGEYFVIFDADFIPREDFILELLPYMSVPNTGIVQSPQFFDYDKKMNKRSWLQFGAGNIQEYFYKIIQSARGRFDGAICVGSCAIYKRTAMNEIGGTAQIDHSEDVYTGFKLLMHNWKIRYIPLVLSKGLCPDDLTAFFKQQTRWCAGSLSLTTSATFWKSKLPVMTKLCFISGLLYYVSFPMMVVLTFQTFFLIVYHSDSIGFWNLAVFVPTLFVAILMQLFYIYPRFRIGTILAHGAATWFYTYAVITLLFGHTEKWNPTGLKHKISKGYLSTVIASSIYICIYISSIAIMSFYQKIDFSNIYLYPLLFWIVVNIIYHLVFWINSITHLHKQNIKEKSSNITWILNLQRIGLPVFLGFCFVMIISTSLNPNHLHLLDQSTRLLNSTTSSSTVSSSDISSKKTILESSSTNSLYNK